MSFPIGWTASSLLELAAEFGAVVDESMPSILTIPIFKMPRLNACLLSPREGKPERFCFAATLETSRPTSAAFAPDCVAKAMAEH